MGGAGASLGQTTADLGHLGGGDTAGFGGFGGISGRSGSAGFWSRLGRFGGLNCRRFGAV